MIRRNFLKGLSLLTGATITPTASVSAEPPLPPIPERQYWRDTMIRIAAPVLTSLANNTLKSVMPVESAAGAREGRTRVTHLEALGRTLAGLAPWLELDEVSPAEARHREQYIRLCVSALENAVNPASVSYLNFTEGGQPLVDAAFLAHALIRAPKKIWGNLSVKTQGQLLTALRSTRIIKPHYNNWLLFTAMIEAALLKFSGEYDAIRIDYAIKEHKAWYKGDGVYGDGPEFHFDYYNSYVIHPMLLDIVRTVHEKTGTLSDELSLFVKRAQRYAEIQERLVSPEGTFPPVGRSLAYRCGAFQLLAQMALQKLLPERLPPAQVRCALGAVIRSTIDPPGTFDQNGWLTIGLAGHQPSVGETYISTGSLYLCTTGFLPLGLAETDPFWSGPSADWTSKKAFSGKDFGLDKAL